MHAGYWPPYLYNQDCLKFKRMNRKFAFILVGLLSLLPVMAWSSDFDKGMEHLKNGDYALAFCLWQPMAIEHDPKAQYHLGWLYANGLGLNADIKSAVYWWQHAAKNGHLDAQFSIGLSYLTGEGIKADRKEAFKWFLKAAKENHEDARDLVKRLVLESDENYHASFPELKNLEWLQQSFRVTADILNIRSGPGTDFEIIHKVKKDEILTGISQKNDWIEVIIDKSTNKTGWIYAQLVRSL